MKERLCIPCTPEKTCRFKEAVNRLINPPTANSPLWINQNIDEFRDLARKLACPNVNFNPDYPGRNKL